MNPAIHALLHRATTRTARRAKALRSRCARAARRLRTGRELQPASEQANKATGDGKA